MGGSQTTETDQKSVAKPPKWFEDAAIKSLQVADRINQAGYVPYMGNQIAAFTPTQQAAMQGVNDWAAAANGTAPVNAMAGMPQAKTDQTGVAGYETASAFMKNLAQMRQRFPQQYQILSQFGGDLLANPAQAPASVKDSPWQVGATAAASQRAATAGGAGGSGPYTLKQLLEQGAKGGTAGTLAAFMGVPYWRRDQNGNSGGMTSAFQQLYDRDILNGRNPFAQTEVIDNMPAPVAPPPVPPSGPSWWDPEAAFQSPASTPMPPVSTPMPPVSTSATTARSRQPLTKKQLKAAKKRGK